MRTGLGGNKSRGGFRGLETYIKMVVGLFACMCVSHPFLHISYFNCPIAFDKTKLESVAK